jgi:hypothetical protein
MGFFPLIPTPYFITWTSQNQTEINHEEHEGHEGFLFFILHGLHALHG